MTLSAVIDNSIVIRWFHPSGTKTDLDYADTVLTAIENEIIIPIAPVILTMEFPNVLHTLKRRRELNGSIETALMHWEHLSIKIIGSEYKALLYMQTLHQLCSRHNLTTYDAAYLELAIRTKSSLLTLDKKLKKAAKKENLFSALK